MDRLSSHAARESELEPTRDKLKSEEEATAALLEKLRISKANQKKNGPTSENQNKTTNGESAEGDPSQQAADQPQEDTSATHDKPDAPNGPGIEDDAPRKRGIPQNIQLYQIFYEQVTHLVTAQRLQIQDTIALLVSLLNLAL